MSKHPGCVTDPLVKQWWREYRHVMKDGNPLGMSFAEYVAARLASLGPREYVGTSSNAPSYVAGCGHTHAWGASCSSLTI